MRPGPIAVLALAVLPACSSPKKDEGPREPTASEREVAALRAEGAELARAGKYREAADRFKSACVVDPRDVKSQYDLAVVLDDARDWTGAAEAYERVLVLDPRIALAHHNLGEVALARGDRARARRAFEQAAELDPDFALTWIDLARVEVEDGNPGAAVRVLERATARLDLPPVWYHLGLARELANDPARAQEAFEHAIKMDPRHAESLNELALIHEARREVDEAIALWQRAVEADPRCVEAEKNLGIALYKRKDKGYLALRHLKAYVDLGGKDERVARWVSEIREAVRTYRTDDRASAVFDRFEPGRLFTADQSFVLRDDGVAARAAGLKKGDRVRVVFESAASPRVVDLVRVP
jgi:superkiller protein 3